MPTIKQDAKNTVHFSDLLAERLPSPGAREDAARLSYTTLFRIVAMTTDLRVATHNGQTANSTIALKIADVLDETAEELRAQMGGGELRFAIQ